MVEKNNFYTEAFLIGSNIRREERSLQKSKEKRGEIPSSVAVHQLRAREPPRSFKKMVLLREGNGKSPSIA